jgi:hypothetical protein
MPRVKCFFCGKRTYCLSKHNKKCSHFRQLSSDVLYNCILPHTRKLKLTKLIYDLAPRFFHKLKKNNMLYRTHISRVTKILSFQYIKNNFMIFDMPNIQLYNKKRMIMIFTKIDYDIEIYRFYYKRNGKEYYKQFVYNETYMVPPQCINLYYKLILLYDRVKYIENKYLSDNNYII